MADTFRFAPSTIQQWLDGAIPGDRVYDVADFVAAADRLRRMVKPEHVAVVVRNPSPHLDGRTLVDVAVTEGPARMLSEVIDTFDIRRVQP